MNLILRIPDELVSRLRTGDGDLERRALEAFALAEYQAGRLTRPELTRVLGFTTRYELDGFLEAHGINESRTPGEFESDRETLGRLDTARVTAGRALASGFREFRRGRTLGGLDPKKLIREGLR